MNYRDIKKQILLDLRLNDARLSDDEFKAQIVNVNKMLNRVNEMPFMQSLIVKSPDENSSIDFTMASINALKILSITDNYYEAYCYPDISASDIDNEFQYAQTGQDIKIRNAYRDVNIYFTKAMPTRIDDIDLETDDENLFGFIFDIYDSGLTYFVKRWQKNEDYVNYKESFDMALLFAQRQQADILMSAPR